jgi:clan AA aspartic protease (TIGR02281 family)
VEKVKIEFMKKFFALIALFSALCCMPAVASDDYSDSYNFTRGMEEAQNGNYSDALSYMQKEVADHPKNAYAYVIIATIDNAASDYANALQAANLALKNVHKKEKKMVAACYNVRASVYMALSDTDKALSDYDMAIKAEPEDLDYYQLRADIYFYRNQFDKAEADFRQMLKVDESSSYAYVGLGRNEKQQEHYDKALPYYDKAIKLSPSYSAGYSFRAESYFRLHRYSEAAEDIISALDIDQNDKAFMLMCEMADSSQVVMEAKLKSQCIKNPGERYWPFCLGAYYRHIDDYENAVEYYKRSYDLQADTAVALYLAKSLHGNGDLSDALSWIDKTKDQRIDDAPLMEEKMDILHDMGRDQEALLIVDSLVRKNPSESDYYYKRANFKLFTKNVRGAVSDMDTCITLTPDVSYYYFTRGRFYKILGNTSAAKYDFQQSINMDTIDAGRLISMYAYAMMGNEDSAKACIEKLLKNSAETNDALSEAYYNVACIYSLLVDNKRAFDYLKKAQEKGMRNLYRAECDPDLLYLRTSPEYKAMFADFRKKKAAAAAGSTSTFVSKTGEVPFVRESGICKVKCQINGLPLQFFFDTGASSVSISSLEATFMLKNGYLTQNDVVGTQNYMNANGEVESGTVVNLKSVEFGGFTLHNIQASVADNQAAPLLLGQTVLQRLGKIEIDNLKNVIRITYKEKSQEK